MEDAEAMARVRAGHLESLAPLFERHHVHLFNFYLRQTGSRSLSEDLVQDVFVRLLRYRASYRPGAAFLPWMWQIARNAQRDHHSRHPVHLPLEALKAEVPDAQEGPEARLIRDQDSTHLLAALARLTPQKRELLLLSRAPGLSYQDLAQVLACSVGAVKVQVHRALKELRTRFIELQGGRP